MIHFRNDPIVNQSNISLALHAIKKPQSSKIYDVFPQNSAIEKYINSVKSSLNSAIDQNKFNKVPNKELIRIKKTISKLKNNKDIVIKPTDKNLGLCIMDADFYLKECHRQLDDSSTYKKLDKSPNFKGILTQLKRILYKFNHLYNKDNSLTYLAKTILYPLINNIYKIGKFYIIPKVHKPTIVGRPIVNCIDTFTSFTSKLLDKLLQPIMKRFPSYIKDSNELVLHLDSLKFDKNVLFFTADVVNLYPSIDINEGLISLEEAMNLFKTDNAKLILELCKWTLMNNYFSFNNVIYKQIKGVAMGQSMAVCFACIYMSMLERKCFQKCKLIKSDFKYPLYFKRYIDDIFSVWKNKEDAEIFANLMNTKMHKNIAITSEFSNHSCVFLDLKIYKGDNFSHSDCFDIVLFQKAINKYQYIPHKSFHSKFIFKSFIQSELNRYLLKCTNPFDFFNMKKLFYGRLLRRGYKDNYLMSIFNQFQMGPAELKLLRQQKIASLKKTYFQEKNSVQTTPLIYKTRFSPIHLKLNLNKILKPTLEAPLHFDPDWDLITNRKDPIICYMNNHSIGGLLQRL